MSRLNKRKLSNSVEMAGEIWRDKYGNICCKDGKISDGEFQDLITGILDDMARRTELGLPVERRVKKIDQGDGKEPLYIFLD